MRRFRGLSILMAVALVTLLFAGMAFASTDNTAKSIKSVDNDEQQTLGDLKIYESEDQGDSIDDSTTFMLTLPSGVEFDEETIDANADGVLTHTELYTAFVDSISWGSDNGVALTDGVELTLSPNKRTLTVDVNNMPVAKVVVLDRDSITFNMPVNFDGFSSGDVAVEINGMDGGVTSGTVVVGRAVDGDAVVTALDIETIGEEGGECGTIRIEESSINAFAGGEVIVLTLPKGYTWDNSSAVQLLAGFNDAAVAVATVNGSTDGNNNTSDRDYTITITDNRVTKESRGIIEITPFVDVDTDDADFGDLEVTVDSDDRAGDDADVEKTDVVVAKYADFGVDVSADSDVKEVMAGDGDEELTKLVIKEGVPGSLDDNKTIKVKFPNYVKILAAGVDLDRQEGTDIIAADAPDEDEVTLTVNIESTDAVEYEVTFDVSIAIDAPAGDLVAKLSGSAGLEDEVVLGKIVKPVIVTTTPEDVNLGASNQVAGDILIKENEDEALNEGQFVVRLPEGAKFSSVPKVEVSEGNLEIDEDDVDLDNDDRDLIITIDSESTKVSAIKISDIKLDVDRTVAYGAIKVEVRGTDDDGSETIDFVGTLGDCALFDNYEETEGAETFDATVAATAVIANVTAPAVETNGMFYIGSTVYSQNGSMKVMDAAPYIKNDRTYVPVRYLAYMLGVTEDNVKWDETTQTVTLTKGDKEVQLVIGSTNIMVNGEAKTMDVAPEISSDRTMLPARFVAEGLGYTVGWNAATQSVVISK